MMEEEEEVLFDQAGLLTNRVKPVPSVKVHITSSKLFKTFSLCAAFFGLGLCIAIPGPTLLDLQARTGTDTETISRIFTGRSVGYLLGSILGGLLFDRFNQECLLSFALLLTAVGTALAPWSRNIALLLVLFAFQGISMGMLDTGGNVMCLDIWGRNSAPYMQTLHFAFGLGAFVAPLIAEPFLAPQNLSDINITDTPSLPDFTRPPNLGNSGNHRRDVDEVESAGRVGMQALLMPSSVNKPLRLSRDKPWETHDLVMRDNSLAENDRSKRETSEKEEISEKNLAAPPTVERVTNTTVSEAPPAAPKPKKPITSGKSLSQDKNVADGSKNDKELHKIDQKEKPQPVEKIKDISAVKSSIAPKTLVNCEINDTSAECKEDFTKEADSTDIVEGTSPLPTTTTKTTTTTTTTTMAPTTSTTIKATTTTSLPPKSENIGGKNRNDTGNIDIENSAKPVSTTELPTNVTSSSIKNTVHKLINNVSEVINNLTKVQFAYITIAIFLYLMSVMFMCLCCFGSRSLRASRSSEIQGEYIIHKESKGFRIQILILLFLFYFLYVGMEVTYGGLIMTFAVTYLDWSKPKATFLTSVFWGSFAAGRGLAIFLSRCLSPVIMLISDLVLTCISLAGLVLVMETNHNMLWFCTITIGIGMSSIFPTGITWAERYMHLTGKATAVFVVGSALGEMAIPAITGFLFQNKSPMWLIYILLGSGLLSAILYIIMQNLASNKGERYERLNSLLTLASDDTEEMELEMDSVSVASSTSNHNHNHNHNENMTSAGTNGTNRKKVTFKLPGESPSSSPRNNVGRKIGSIFTGSNAKQD